MSKEHIICADVIALYGSKFVLIERIGDGSMKIALPGGKQDPGESLSETAERELWEETGLLFVMDGVLGTYPEKDRDPRGWFVSTIFTGAASGIPCDEKEKTRVLLLEREQILALESRFAFDHFEILQDYFHLIDTQTV